MLWLSIVFLEILLFEFIFESTIVMNYLSLVNLQVLSRLAPFERGIYEDYVANFWCTTSVLVKWKRIFTIQSLKLLSLGATVSTCLPSMVQQIWAPSNQGFLYGLLNSAFSFYMFSFQGKSSFFFIFWIWFILFFLISLFIVLYIKIIFIVSIYSAREVNFAASPACKPFGTGRAFSS